MQEPSNTPLDSCRGLNVKTMDNGYRLVRLELPAISPQASPGDLIKIAGASMPVMRNNKSRKWLDILVTDTQASWPDKEADNLPATLLSEYRFQINDKYSRPLLIAQDSGMAAIIFLAETLKKKYKIIPTVLLEFSGDLPFRLHPSQIMTPVLPPDVIATIPLLEDLSIPCRLANNNARPGCYDGDIIELAEHWLKGQQTPEQVSIYICGENKTIALAAKLAQKFSVPCQAIKMI